MRLVSARTVFCSLLWLFRLWAGAAGVSSCEKLPLVTFATGLASCVSFARASVGLAVETMDFGVHSVVRLPMSPCCMYFCLDVTSRTNRSKCPCKLGMTRLCYVSYPCLHACKVQRITRNMNGVCHCQIHQPALFGSRMACLKDRFAGDNWASDRLSKIPTVRRVRK